MAGSGSDGGGVMVTSMAKQVCGCACAGDAWVGVQCLRLQDGGLGVRGGAVLIRMLRRSHGLSNL